jgi:CheY-like chemotaxis protein
MPAGTRGGNIARVFDVVLVADDHPGSLDLACYLLEQDGFEVLRARSGLEALTLATERRPDVVVLDLDMPGLDGIEARDRMAEHPELANVPIVAMTVLDIDERWPNRAQAEFALYVRKPLDPHTFAELVRSVLTR